MGFYSFAERKDQTLKPLWKKTKTKTFSFLFINVGLVTLIYEF